ncbi:15081_t:CDS:1 [Dentiscutata erythropus]|uniref:15081_t:CDS:1 n=1 Tax=Dentiscutata erythropus TaxID=1348616 RepID=A0A9N9HLM7_9GLOM|nr:15081_t:CDS:1 [Dentiscutata erythropus]
MSTNDDNNNISTTINKFDIHKDNNRIDKVPALQLINPAAFSNQSNQISKSFPPISHISHVEKGQITSMSTASGSRSSSASDSNDTDISVYSESTSSVPPTHPEYGESFGEIDNSFKGKGKEVILNINDTYFNPQRNTTSPVDIGIESLTDTSYHLNIGSTLHQPFSSNTRSYNVYEVLAEIGANTSLSYTQYQEQVSKSVHIQQQEIKPFFSNKSKGNETYDINSYVSIKKNNLEYSVNGTSTVVIAKYMFWIGWLIMPTWWIGSFYLPRPTSDATPDDYKWRNRCRKASIWGFIGLILVGIFYVILKSRNYDDET